MNELIQHHLLILSRFDGAIKRGCKYESITSGKHVLSLRLKRGAFERPKVQKIQGGFTLKPV